MCGISGIVKFDRTDAVSPETLKRMNDAIRHRGPDDEGFFVEGSVGLGHRRLSIIDLAGGRQPIFNEDESVVVVFNGEIYNYLELTRKLSARGHRFRTRSDTETIVHAYEEYGHDCLRHLDGMFAFALWDRRRNRLLLARDRLGKKPVYYYSNNRFLAFGSEIKSLLEVPDVPVEVDREALDLYLTLRYVPGPWTMFRGISKLQPGHAMAIENGKMSVWSYWDLEYTSEKRTFEDTVSEFRRLLGESVRKREMSEVPLGVFLSGGIDSTSILAAMSETPRGKPVQTFTVGYRGGDGEAEESNEFEYARLAAEHFGSDHHEFRIDADDFRDFLPDLVWYLDEPLADPSCIPLYFIARQARDHVTVVLSGEGADEILGGYGIYQKMLLLERIRSVPGMSKLASVLAPHVPHEKIQSYMHRASLPLAQRYRGVSFGVRPDLKDQLLGVAAPMEFSRNPYAARLQLPVETTALNRMLYADTRVWLPDDLLMKADKMTMANSMELRIPFLDRDLVEFCATLPDDMKIRGRQGKHLLRHAVRGVVPDRIIDRSKKGFPVPTRSWLRGAMRDGVRETLLDSQAACLRYMDRDALRGIVEDHETGRAREQEIWTLLTFEFWHRGLVEGRSGRARPDAELLEGVV